MTDRTDHAAEARKHIDWAHDQQGRDGEYDSSVRDNAILAQAEATLALVEQQRMANLIALAQFSFDGWEPNAAQRKLFGPQIGTEASELTDDARRVLGLTVESR